MNIKYFGITMPFLFFLLPLQATPTKISFRLVGKLVVVQATVDGLTGNFILDTGVDHLVLNKKYYKGFPVNEKFFGINGEVGSLEATYVKVQLSDLSWKGTYAKIIPLAAIERARGLRIHGLIGGQLFRKYRLWLSYDKKEIQLEMATKVGNFRPFVDSVNVVEQRFKSRFHTPCLAIELGRQTFRFALDTGAETNVIHKDLQEVFDPHFNLDNKTPIHGFLVSPQSSDATRLYGVKVGTIFCQPMPVAFVDLSEWNRQTNGPDVDGILGYEFLRQFEVCIDFKFSKIYFSPSQETKSNTLPVTKK